MKSANSDNYKELKRKYKEKVTQRSKTQREN
jgi:hypothetical protein